ncbi:class I SAM-dependent methyltransferase [Streptomyces eurythermus]|uniref:class I SAM-dependent methyltransferase n=1 Tax=Streptomyces eurythermus TaxID=42237 RepID=UPI00341156C3
MTDDRSAACDEYAQSKPQRRRSNAKGETTRFNWTQFPDHGPGADVPALKPGDMALDLGCGSGGNASHLATLGMKSVGIDLSGRQLDKARERWPDADGMELHQGDALACLGDTAPEPCSFVVCAALPDRWPQGGIQRAPGQCVTTNAG